MKVRYCPPLILLLLLSSVLTSATIAIFYDGSKSMQGFAKEKSFEEMDSKLSKAIAEAGMTPAKFIFWSNQNGETTYKEVKNTQELSQTVNFPGDITLLDKPIEWARQRYGAAVLVTDNVYTEQRVGETERFYKAIQDTRVMSQLDVIPLSEAFDGNPWIDGVAYHKGNRGLQVYLVRLQGDLVSEQKHEQMVKILNQKHYPGKVLHFYPIDARHLLIEPLKKTTNQLVYTIEPHGKEYYLKLRRNQEAVTATRSNASTGIEFTFTMRSNYPHFYIQKGTKISLEDLRVKAGNLKIKNEKCSISPERLGSDLVNRSKTEKFTGKICLHPEANLMQDIVLMVQRPLLNLSFKIKLDTAKHSLRMDKDTFNKHYSTNMHDLDKIYTPYDLLQYLNPNSQGLILLVRSKDIQVQSGRETESVLVLILILAVLLIVIYKVSEFIKVKPLKIIYGQEHAIVQRFKTYPNPDFILTNKARLRLKLTNPELVIDNLTPRNGNIYFLSRGVVYSLMNRNHPAEIKTLSTE